MKFENIGLILIAFAVLGTGCGGSNAPATNAQADTTTGACSNLSGTWANKSSEIGGYKPTVLAIQANCQVNLISGDERHEDEGLIPDHLFWKGKQLRIQYATLPGKVDGDGKPIPYPLSDEQKRSYQGNVHQNKDGSIYLNMDMFDTLCGDTPCNGANFYRQ